MSISMRELFGRQEIEGEIISLRNSLAKHPSGAAKGLREAHARFSQPASGDGYARGCRRPESVKISFGFGKKEVGAALPNWVAVAGKTRLVRNHTTGESALAPDFAGETRTVEGLLVQSRITHTDFPLHPWHTYYDWNFFVVVDRQYTYLYSESNLYDWEHHYNGVPVLECEWDTAFLPSWAWPQSGSRIWMVGRWIYDCGHPGNHGHKTEIHPPKAVASFRSEAVHLPGNSRPTRANSAVLFIGSNGGYWTQPIGDQNYRFDLYLPPKPAPEAVPLWSIAPMTGDLPVQPRVSPYPADAPRLLQIEIPLREVTPEPQTYGAIISGGWSDAHGTEAAKTRRLRLVVDRIYLPLFSFERSELLRWHVYLGIHGHWQIVKLHNGYPSEGVVINSSGKAFIYLSIDSIFEPVELDLHPSDEIRLTVCGFEVDAIHSLMGDRTGLTWADIVDRRKVRRAAGRIRDAFAKLTFWVLEKENDPLSVSSLALPPTATGEKVFFAPGNDYGFRYKVIER